MVKHLNSTENSEYSDSHASFSLQENIVKALCEKVTTPSFSVRYKNEGMKNRKQCVKKIRHN
jgi:hypothetical protein